MTSSFLPFWLHEVSTLVSFMCTFNLDSHERFLTGFKLLLIAASQCEEMEAKPLDQRLPILTINIMRVCFFSSLLSRSRDLGSVDATRKLAMLAKQQELISDPCAGACFRYIF